MFQTTNQISYNHELTVVLNTAHLVVHGHHRGPRLSFKVCSSSAILHRIRSEHRVSPIWGFPEPGNTPKTLDLFHGKSHLQMDDLGVPPFRVSPIFQSENEMCESASRLL